MNYIKSREDWKIRRGGDSELVNMKGGRGQPGGSEHIDVLPQDAVVLIGSLSKIFD